MFVFYKRQYKNHASKVRKIYLLKAHCLKVSLGIVTREGPISVSKVSSYAS